MDTFYLLIVLVLVLLALVDLSVGVANDAVNFLNSAVGSKVASRWVILSVASVGLVAGTLTSNGLMEIARSGVFHPEMFTFHEVMMIFLTVMICDVILLDMFNTFGLPTSSTVSLIFELLGAAVFVALYKIWTSPPETVNILINYINAGRALTLISAILASVVVAFVFGTVIMFISRLLFSFRYKRSFRKFGAVYSGLCLTAIAYFAIFKGLKYSTVISKESLQWLSDNIKMLLLASFVGFSILMAILQHLFKINILKIIVLAGTFALALAFAGSDLANFIGVTMAGIDSYEIATAYVAAGGNLDTLMMSELAKPVTVHPFYFMLAGSVMLLALWFSKKARTVTDTEVNLSRHDDGGIERFGSTPVSRALVHSAMSMSKRITTIIPGRVNRFIDSRFKLTKYDKKNKASYDLIRASMNLTVAALIISTATSMKLTLSTTYVTFMVAMSTSLADRAWGRESAVYRVTGVLTVISGWFLTALVAFSAAAITALLIMWGGKIVIVGLLLLCVFMMVQSTQLHRRREKKLKTDEGYTVVIKSSIVEQCNEDICSAFEKASRIYTQTLKELAAEEHKKLKKLYKEARDLYEKEKERKTLEMMPTLVKLQEDAVDTGHYYVQVLNYLYELSKSLLFITKASFEHLDNNHKGLSAKQVADLEELNKEVSQVYEDIVKMLRTTDYSNFEDVLARRDSTFDLFVENIKSQIKRVKNNESSIRNSILYLDIVNETKAMMLQARNLMRAQRLFVGFEEEKKKEKEKKSKKNL